VKVRNCNTLVVGRLSIA